MTIALLKSDASRLSRPSPRAAPASVERFGLRQDPNAWDRNMLMTVASLGIRFVGADEDSADVWLSPDSEDVEQFMLTARARGEAVVVVTPRAERLSALLAAGAIDVVVWPQDRVALAARLERAARELRTIRNHAALRLRLGPWQEAGDAPDGEESAGARMHQQLKLLRAMLDAHPGAVAAQDPDGRFVIVNLSMAALLSHAPRELIGRTPAEFMSAAEAAEWKNGVDAAMLVDAPTTREITMRGPSGDTRHFQVTHVRMHGRRSVVLSVAIDITARKALENDLRQAEARANADRERALEATRVKARFLANISHEIRTPMNAILGMTALALDTPLTAEQREYVDAVHSAADSLMTIINDVLDISKIEAGKLAIEEIPFELRHQIKRAMEPLHFRAAQKGLVLTVDVKPEVADTVIGDPVRFRQILVNLVGNALKFTDEGGVTVTVERAAESDELLRVKVKDTGIGIPPEKQALVFDPFAQADDSTTRHFGGTGLGLSICRDLVRLMGGTIGVESTAGQGATFTFTIRLVQHAFWFTDDLREATRGSLAPAKAAAVNAPRPLRVLLAEDNPLNTKLAIALLEKRGCHVVHVVNGAAALEAMKQDAGAFDLVLMDVQMPVMDGLEATRRMREHEKTTGRHLHIAALSANAMKGDAEAGIAAGVDDYLHKPIEQAALRDLLERVAARVRDESVAEALAQPPPPEPTMQTASRPEPEAPAAPPEPAPPPAVPVPSRVDIARLLAVCGDDAEILLEAAEAFRETWRETIGELDKAVASKDPVAVRFSAHKLKGSARAMCMPEASNVCEGMETAARADGAIPDAASLAVLRKLLEASDEDLGREMEKLRAKM